MHKSMATWQVKAIKNGRRPLPEERGQRPWIPEKPEGTPCHPPEASLAQAVRLLQNPPLRPMPGISNLHDQPAQRLATNGPKGSPWTDKEVALLVNLKHRNIGWPGIQVGFNPQGWAFEVSITDHPLVSSTISPTDPSTVSSKSGSSMPS